MGFEVKIIEFLQAGRSPFFDFAFDLISHLGSAVGMVCVCIFMLIFCRRLLFWYLLSYGFVNVTVGILKEAVQRTRPYNLTESIVSIGDIVEDFSFPSGHVACATALAIFLGYFLYKMQKSRGMKALVIVCCSIFVVLVAISRMYLGKHYLTDCLAGFFISAVICTGGLVLMHFYNKEQKIRKGRPIS